MKNLLEKNKTEFDVLKRAMNESLREIQHREKLGDDVTDDLRQFVRDMGIFCHKIGGTRMMQYVWERYVKSYDKKLVEIYWDGIGAWSA